MGKTVRIRTIYPTGKYKILKSLPRLQSIRYLYFFSPFAHVACATLQPVSA